jgi:hypothetical protein
MQTTEDAIREAERIGFDLSLVRESLLLSYDERARRHEEALALALELQQAGAQLRAKSQPPAPTSRLD